MQTNRKWRRAIPVLLALLVLFSVASLAQTFRGGINGAITDPSGAVIPGAKVTATDVATAAVHETVSSGAGEFSFQRSSRRSTYTIKVRGPRFPDHRGHRRAGAGRQDLYAARSS